MRRAGGRGAGAGTADAGDRTTRHSTSRYGALVLATGARELFLPFPGWTLPHVAGAGGLQALVKSGMPIAGKRVVVAGSGPLLLAVAHYLRKRGAIVALVAEQADQAAVTALRVDAGAVSGQAAAGDPTARGRSVRDGLLAGFRARPGRSRCGAASGHGVERCDYLACGFGLVPNTELLDAARMRRASTSFSRRAPGLMRPAK